MTTLKQPYSIFGEIDSSKEWIVMTIKLDPFKLFGISNLETLELRRRELSSFGKNH